MNWNEYPKKESMPADEDELMQLEQQSGANKTIRLIYFFNWILSKLKQHEFTLNTKSKTIEKAINEVDATTKSKADGMETAVIIKQYITSISTISIVTSYTSL